MKKHDDETMTAHEKIVALKSSEDRFRRLFEDSPVAMWEEDFSMVKARLDKLRKGGVSSFKEYFDTNPQVAAGLMSMVTVSIVNSSALSLFKADRKEFLRFSPTAVYGEKNSKAFAAELIAIAEGQTTFENEIAAYTLAGEVRDIAIRWTVSSGYEDSYSSVLVGALDLTERHSKEDLRKQMEIQTRQSEKLESLSVMAGSISHDFNNIIMAVLGYSEMLSGKLPEKSEGRELLEQIENAANRAADLTLQLQTYSGKRRPVVASLDTSKFVEDMERQIRERSLVNAILKIDTGKNMPLISADAAQLRQVLHVLVANSVEAIGDKVGIVTLRTGVMECDRGYLRGLRGGSDDLNAGQYVFIEVVDTGCGMDVETVSRLFTPFFSTKSRRTALNMSVVMGTVRSHNGAIAVTSEPGSGTSIKLIFPRSDKPAKAEFRDDGKSLKKGGLVLVIDDESMIRDVLTFMLKKLGFSVISAADGRSGVELYKQRHKEIVAVLLDLLMPGMPSEETFREIRRINPNAAVLLSTGASDEMAKEQFHADGVAGTIHKPYQQLRLAQAMAALLETK